MYNDERVSARSVAGGAQRSVCGSDENALAKPAVPRSPALRAARTAGAADGGRSGRIARSGAARADQPVLATPRCLV